MPGVGEYLPDGSEGITRIANLPRPRIVRRSRDFTRRPCPQCGHSAYRERVMQRALHDVGDLISGRPREIHPSFRTS